MKTFKQFMRDMNETAEIAPTVNSTLVEKFAELHQRISNREYGIDQDTKMALLSHENKLIFDLLIYALQRRNI